jgi:hypothetical protein
VDTGQTAANGLAPVLRKTNSEISSNNPSGGGAWGVHAFVYDILITSDFIGCLKM